MTLSSLLSRFASRRAAEDGNEKEETKKNDYIVHVFPLLARAFSVSIFPFKSSFN